MNYWLVNHSWESFKATKEYCGFISEEERNIIQVGDGIIYYGQGLVFGVFEAVALVKDEFRGWKKSYPFQVKLKPIVISEKGIIARNMQSKILLQKSAGGSSNILELSELEFNKTIEAVKENRKELRF